MDDSMAQGTVPDAAAATGDLPAERAAWKTAVAWVCAVLLGLLFIVAGLWKLTDHLTMATLMVNALAPPALSVPGALFFGIAETFAGVLLIVPRFRRWGALITAGLLVVFMGYFAWNYAELKGMDCSCFPILKRAIGPGFFWSDGAMLVMAVLAGWWADKSTGLRSAALVLGVVVVIAGVAFGITESRQSGVKAPDVITVEGKPYSLQSGKVLLYFYDPECSHCDAAARRMAKHVWKDVRIVGLPTRVPQFGQYFMDSTDLKAPNSPDHADLKKIFSFGDPPYGVALENGRMKTGLRIFDMTEPEKQLRAMGWIE
jgi:uncharacterized membrane protein YphA (DoxX/SURF4 family)